MVLHKSKLLFIVALGSVGLPAQDTISELEIRTHRSIMLIARNRAITHENAQSALSQELSLASEQLSPLGESQEYFFALLDRSIHYELEALGKTKGSRIKSLGYSAAWAGGAALAAFLLTCFWEDRARFLEAERELRKEGFRVDTSWFSNEGYVKFSAPQYVWQFAETHDHMAFIKSHLESPGLHIGDYIVANIALPAFTGIGGIASLLYFYDTVYGTVDQCAYDRLTWLRGYIQDSE